jgi:hypothetical protein
LGATCEKLTVTICGASDRIMKRKVRKNIKKEECEKVRVQLAVFREKKTMSGEYSCGGLKMSR